jgi:hypothetical protein
VASNQICSNANCFQVIALCRPKVDWKLWRCSSLGFVCVHTYCSEQVQFCIVLRQWIKTMIISGAVTPDILYATLPNHRPLISISTLINVIFNYTIILGQCSRYSDWPWAWMAEGQSSSPGKREIFLLSMSSRPVLGPTHPPLQWVLGALSLGVGWLRHEAHHSPPTSAEFENVWIYTSTPSYIFTV